MLRSHTLLAAALAATSALAPAQTALLREGDPAPGGASGTVAGFSIPAVNSAGGYGCVIVWQDGGVNRFGIWGTLTPGAATLVREPGTLAGLEQVAFADGLGMNDTSFAYAAMSVQSGGGAPIETLWIDDTLVVAQNQLAPDGTGRFRYVQRPTLTTGGALAYFAGSAPTISAPLASAGLYRGTVPLYRSEDTVPSLGGPVSLLGVSFETDLSPSGSRSIAPLAFDTLITGDEGIAIDGTGLALEGVTLRTGNAVPASIGGRPGEAWTGFGIARINDSGAYLFGGETTAPFGQDDVLVQNGAITLREGDMVGGEVLIGGPRGADINANGDTVVVWRTGPAAVIRDALLFNGVLVLKEGDEVDWDGDGFDDPGSELRSIDWPTVRITNDRRIYFIATIARAGTLQRAFFELDVGTIGSSYCSATPNSTGVQGTTFALGRTVASENDVILGATDMPPGAFGIFLVSETADQMPVSAGILCLGGDIGRYNRPAEIFQVTAQGAAFARIDVAALPLGTGLTAVQPGETWGFQAWHRDVDAGTQLANFTLPVAITFQ